MITQLYFIYLCINYVIACPPNDIISPCTCIQSTFACGGHNSLNLQQIFESASYYLADDEKHLGSFYLNNTAITELNEHTFQDITFESIRISNATNLRRIHRNAFTITATNIHLARIEGNSKLDDAEHLFEALSKMPNLRDLYVHDNNIAEIPDNAFRPLNGYQNDLAHISFRGKSFKKLGGKAFYYLNYLQQLEIDNTSISSIPETAFRFSTRDPQFSLKIILLNSPINSSSFAKHVFTDMSRDFSIILPHSDNLIVLDEDVFYPLLYFTRPAKVSLYTQQLFDCCDCRNLWLTKYPELHSHISPRLCYPLKCVQFDCHPSSIDMSRYFQNCIANSNNCIKS